MDIVIEDRELAFVTKGILGTPVKIVFLLFTVSAHYVILKSVVQTTVPQGLETVIISQVLVNVWSIEEEMTAPNLIVTNFISIVLHVTIKDGEFCSVINPLMVSSNFLLQISLNINNRKHYLSWIISSSAKNVLKVIMQIKV